ncbi:sugar MFS transporter [Aestuariicella hydrocarbonica]|uniref:Sugar MFS transporter n=1 Tax=Pseudomaricurvus hydrocarbonicus TaxID=1470433 RepID=A0A9E5JR75_9GAMM|nr:sugar MFS transporter [Aestuariicella hydrocarbonica]
MDTVVSQTERHGSSVMPMFIVGTLFFIFGFVTWLNGSLIPFLQIACELTHMEAYLVTMAFYISYTVMALPMSVILRRTGYRKGMMLGLVIMAVGSLIFIPAAEARMFSIFLVALFILGTGLTILQTASNPYIVHIGPHETAAVRISIMGLMNKGAGIVAPLVFTAFILSDMSQFTEAHLATLDPAHKIAELEALSSRLVAPYLIMAVMLLALAAMVHFSPLPEIETQQDDSDDSAASVMQYPNLILGVIALFFYVGVEVIAGDTIGLFGKEMGVTNFGQLTSYTMVFMVSAYVVGMIVIPRWIKQETALVISAVLGLVLSVMVMTGSGDSYAVWNAMFAWTGVPEIPNVVLFIALLGFANALVWPAIWPMALTGLGRLTSTGSALLIMAISGGAIFPFLYGAIADASGDSQGAYWVMIPCYLFILFYALKGHKLKSWTGR